MTKLEIVEMLKKMSAADLTKIEQEIKEIRSDAVEAGMREIAKFANTGMTVEAAGQRVGLTGRQIIHQDNDRRRAQAGIVTYVDHIKKRYICPEDGEELVITKNRFMVRAGR